MLSCTDTSSTPPFPASEHCIYFHKSGDFITSDSRRKLALLESKAIYANLLHEVFEVLQFDNEECEHYSTKSRDECIQTAFESDLKSCTTPFGNNSMKVCTEKFNDAWQKFATIRKDDYTKSCPQSCKQIILSFARYAVYDNPDTKNIWVEITFEKYVKVSQTKEAYSFLSLIAEVGGYVGLFLGISVNQISLIFKSLITWLAK